ncbi:MAG TPA: S24 family peptidase [Terriglobia bacterium]|nr:S24 family peptidase [Terriglobia bacterium]
MDHFRKAISDRIAEKDLKLNAISKELGRNPTYMHQFLNYQNPIKLDGDDRDRLAEMLELAPETLREMERGEIAVMDRLRGEISAITDVRRSGKFDLSEQQPRRSQRLPEIDVRAGMGPGQVPVDIERPVDFWEVPRGFFGRSGELLVVQVKGESMEPVLKTGDRVIIDRSDTVPSPGGIFGIFDGHGVIVKYVETIAQSNPLQIRIFSGNPPFTPQDMVVQDDTIVGRVLGYVRRF